MKNPMNLFTRFIKKAKDKLMPEQLYKVEILLYNEATDSYFGGTKVTTTARTRAGAKNNIKAHVRLHVGKAYLMKEKVNGSK